MNVKRAIRSLELEHGRKIKLLDSARLKGGILILLTEDISPELDGGRVPSVITHRLTVFRSGADHPFFSRIIDSEVVRDARPV